VEIAYTWNKKKQDEEKGQRRFLLTSLVLLLSSSFFLPSTIILLPTSLSSQPSPLSALSALSPLRSQLPSASASASKVILVIKKAAVERWLKHSHQFPAFSA
jgi:hypothetical protein